MKKVISVIVACVLMLSLCACVSTSTPTLIDTPSNTQAPTEATTPVETEGEKVFQLGDSVELDGVVVTFLDVIKSKGSSYNKPASGNIFVLCEFEIANNSDEEVAVSSMLSFSAYHDDYACDASFSALLEKGNRDQLDGSVAPGKKMKGVVGFELPKDWTELEVHYTPDVFSSSEIVFIAANNK